MWNGNMRIGSTSLHSLSIDTYNTVSASGYGGGDGGTSGALALQWPRLHYWFDKTPCLVLSTVEVSVINLPSNEWLVSLISWLDASLCLIYSIHKNQR